MFGLKYLVWRHWKKGHFFHFFLWRGLLEIVCADKTGLRRTWPPGPGIELLKYSVWDLGTFSTLVGALFCLKLAKPHQIDENSPCGEMDERLFPGGQVSAAYLFLSGSERQTMGAVSVAK